MNNKDIISLEEGRRKMEKQILEPILIMIIIEFNIVIFIYAMRQILRIFDNK